MGVPLGIVTQQIVSGASAELIGSGISAARSSFQQSYEQNPILLFGGIASGTLGGTLAFTSLCGNLDPRFAPMVGAALITTQVAQYPFANSSVAANAIIQQPLAFSMLMTVPACGTAEGSPNITGAAAGFASGFVSPVSTVTAAGYTSKSAAMTNLVSKLTQHNNLGGTYSIMTPSYTYSNCLLTGMYDVSSGESKQVQYAWRLDFVQPLISLQAAAEAFSTLMSKLNAQLPVISPDWSGQTPGVAPSSQQ